MSKPAQRAVLSSSVQPDHTERPRAPSHRSVRRLVRRCTDDSGALRHLARSRGRTSPAGVDTETQYIVAGARLVYDHDATSGFDFVDPDQRVA